MSNRYLTLDGSKKISETYTLIPAGFDKVQQDVDTNKTTADNHIANADIHVTAAKKAEWDSKAPGSTQTELEEHVENADIHVTAAQKEEWDGKAAGTLQGEVDDHIADTVVHLTKQEHDKLTGIQEGAQKNQNSFAKVNDINASTTTDQFFIVGGVGITITTDPVTKKVTVTATGEATPGPHGSSHNSDGSDPIPDLVELQGVVADQAADIQEASDTAGQALTTAQTALGKADAAETPAGAQAKANEAQQAAEDYADQKDALIKADYIRQPAFASTSGTATAYTVTLDPAPSSIPDGFGITIVPHVDSGANPTLSINGLTAISLKKQDGSAAEMKAGKPYSFRKVGTDFLANSGQGGGANVNGQKEVVFEYGETINQYDPVHVPVISSSASVSSDISTNSRWIAANPDNVHVAVGVQTGNYLELYKRNAAGTGYDKLTSPPSPGAMPNRLVWSDDGQHLYVGLSDAPYFVIYKLSGDTLTKLPSVSNAPTSAIYSLATNGNLVVLSVAASPFFYIYKRNGDSFIKLSNPSVLPPNTFTSSAFSSDGLVFAICPTASPYLILYSVSNDVFSKIADPSILPTGRINAAFTSDDYLFGATYSSATTINVISYKRTGTDFAYTSDSITVTVASSSSGLIALTKQFGLFALKTANNVYVYRRNGSKLYPTPITLTGNIIQTIEFTADAQFFFIGNATLGPYFTAYKTIDRVRKVTSAASVMSPIYAGYAKESGVAGDKKTIISIFN